MAKKQAVKVTKKNADDNRVGPKKAKKLTAEVVIKLLKKGITVNAVAAKYGITKWTLYYRFGKAIKGIAKKGPRPAKKSTRK